MGGFRQGFGLVLAQGLVLAIATPSAWAAPKTVAIVNLCQTLDGRQAAESARRSLERVDELRPIQVGDLSRALETPLDGDDPTQPILKASRAALVQSDKAFLSFQNRQAKSELDKARRQLFSLAPSEASNKMLADLSLRMAQVHLRAQNRGLALGELQLLHRLVP